MTKVDSTNFTQQYREHQEVMPNRLSEAKIRKSVAEHRALFAVLDSIAVRENISSTELMRTALREAVRKRLGEIGDAEHAFDVLRAFLPKFPDKPVTRSRISRFKRNMREFDQLLLDLGVHSPGDIESRNSAVSPKCRLRIFELEHGDA